jgi:molecular chaperone GrpE (heat shock protein)
MNAAGLKAELPQMISQFSTRSFKDMDNKYAGMTVNERLWVSGLMDEFERAISQKNTDEAVRILTEVELTEENIKPILVKYGLCSELG